MYANADEAQDSWNQQATARIWGDTDIYPGMCVDVVTANPTYVPLQVRRPLARHQGPAQDGHQQFQTQLTLIRPSNKTQIRQDAYEPFWVTAGRPKPTLAMKRGCS